MKKHFVTAIAFLATTAAFAQTQTKDSVTSIVKKPVSTAPAPKQKKDWSKIDLTKRANDHLIFELGYCNWLNTPDSIRISGFNRSVNIYFMFDFPFKSDPRLSIGAGLGIGTDNVFFHQQQVLVAAQGNTTLAFPDNENSNHFKKYKLVTTNLEVPLELRFCLDPENTNKSWKFAIGAKVGLMLSAYTKGKTWQNAAGQTLGNFTEKESSKQYFNSTKLAGTARINKGVFGIFAQVQANSLLKTSAGPSVFPISFGLVISGL